MAAGERNGRAAQPVRDPHGRAAGDHLRGVLADSDHDPGRRGPQGVEVVLVVGAGDDVMPEERVVAGAVVLGRQAERGGVGRGPVQVLGADQARVADERDELRHGRAEAAAQVRLLDVLVSGERPGAVRRFEDRGRLVRDERADLLRVPGDQDERIDRPAAAREDVHRARLQLGDQPVQVIGVLVGRGLQGAVRALAAAGAPGVVGDDRAVGEVPGQGGEAVGAHGRSDHQQDWVTARLGGSDVVMQHGARHGQGAGLRLGHRWRPFRE